MTTVTLGSLSLVTGLSWRFHGSRRDHRTALMEERPKGFVERACDDGVLAGWSAHPLKAGEKHYAGGFALGSVLSNALIYQDIEPGTVWVCALRDGLPLPETDVVGTEAAVTTVMGDVLAYQPDLPIYGSHPAAVQSLENLLEGVKPPSHALLKRPGHNVRKAVTLGLSLGIVAVSGYLLWPAAKTMTVDYVTTVTAPALPTTVASVPTLPAVIRGPDPQEIAEATRKAREDWLRQSSFTVVSDQWLAMLRSLPVSHVGYRPRQLECRQDYCLAEWMWTGGRFNTAALIGLPGEVQPASAPRDYAAQVRTRWPLSTASLAPVPTLPDDAVEGFVLAVVSALALPGVRTEVTLPTAPITLSIDVGSHRLTETIGHYGTIRVLTSTLAESHHVLSLLARLPVIAERATFILNGATVSLNLEVRYVVLGA